MQHRSWMSRVRRRRGAEQWEKLAARADGLPDSDCRSLRGEAKSLRRDLTAFLAMTDVRSRRSRAVLEAMPLPAGTDWRWRAGFLTDRLSPSGISAPVEGQKLGEQVAVWHDCARLALILRQTSGQQAGDLAPFGLKLEVMGFTGSYLSLSVDLPDEARNNLLRHHILRLETAFQVERPLRVFARLNINHGPNTEKLLRELPEIEAGQSVRRVVEFDLNDTEMNESRLSNVWLDLIFESPQMNAIDIRELLMSRHPRADL